MVQETRGQGIMRFPATLVAMLVAVALAGCAQPNAGAQSAQEDVAGDSGTDVVADFPPTATLQASPSSGQAPLKVVFSLSAKDPEGAAVEWTLDFGDGSAKQEGTKLPVAVEHTFSRGTWTVTFAANDGKLTAAAKVVIRASLTQTQPGPPTSASSTPSPSPSSSTTTSTPPTTASTTTSSTSTTATSTTTTTSSTTTSTSATTSTSTSATATSSTTTSSSASTSTSQSSTDTSTSSTGSETTSPPPPGNGTNGG